MKGPAEWGLVLMRKPSAARPDKQQDMRSSVMEALRRICAETHQISDQGHCFPLSEVWHAVDAVKSTAHPGDREKCQLQTQTEGIKCGFCSWFTDPADKSREAMPTLSPRACDGGEEEELMRPSDKEHWRLSYHHWVVGRSRTRRTREGVGL